MKDINIAILGFGFMGKVYAYAASSMKYFYPDAPRVNISNVLVSENTNISKVLNRYNFDNVTKNYDEILNDEATNAVYIALPNNLHLDYLAPAVSSKKHILCEKPLETDLKKATEMVQLVDDSNLVSHAVFEYRFLPAVELIKKLINEKKLGNILQFRILYLHGSYAEQRPMSWRLKKGVGGALLDLGPHVIDLALYLLGPFKSFQGTTSTKYPEREVDDISQILCETVSGADGYIEVSRLSVGSIDELRIEIHGDNGAIKWNMENLNFIQYFDKGSSQMGYQLIPVFKGISDTSDFPPPKVSSDWLRPHIHLLYSFVRSIADDDFTDPRSASFSDGLQVQSIINNIIQRSGA